METTYKNLTLKCAGFEGITIKAKKTGFMPRKQPFISHNISTLYPTMVPIETCKNGDFFMLKSTNVVKDSNVFSFDGYCNIAKKYQGSRWTGEGMTSKKKGTMVYVGFEF